MATDIANTVLTCRLVEDPKVISPKMMAIRVAWNSWDGTEEVGNFIDVKLLGERWQKGISQFLTKGAKVALTGDMREEKWEGKEGKRSKIVLLARDVVLMGGKGDGAVPAKSVGWDTTPAGFDQPASPSPAADDMSW